MTLSDWPSAMVHTLSVGCAFLWIWINPLYLSLSTFCDETSRTWGPLGPETRHRGSWLGSSPGHVGLSLNLRIGWIWVPAHGFKSQSEVNGFVNTSCVPDNTVRPTKPKTSECGVEKSLFQGHTRSWGGSCAKKPWILPWVLVKHFLIARWGRKRSRVHDQIVHISLVDWRWGNRVVSQGLRLSVLRL